MELEGSLREFAFCDVLAFLAQGRLTGELRLSRAEEEVTLAVRPGGIVYRNGEARVAGAGGTGEPARERIRDLFLWSDGSFKFERAAEGNQALPADNGKEDLVAIEPLLQEYRERRDEWQSVMERFLSRPMALRVRPLEHGEREGLGLSEEAWRVLALLNGCQSAQSVCRRSHLGALSTCRILADLEEKGLVRQTPFPLSPEPLVRAGEDNVPPPANADGAEDRSDRAPRAQDEGIARLLRRLGRSIRRNGAPAPLRYKTPVRLLCEAINAWAEGLSLEQGMAEREEIQRTLWSEWNGALLQHPRADLVSWREGKLCSERFDGFVRRMGEEVFPKQIYEDTIGALARLFERLYAVSVERLGRRKAGRAVDRALEATGAATATTDTFEGFDLSEFLRGAKIGGQNAKSSR